MLRSDVAARTTFGKSNVPGISVSLRVAALVLGGLVVGALLAEGLVRAVSPRLTYRYPRGLFVNDQACGYRLAPGFVGRMYTPEYTTTLRINGEGLREDHEIAAKPAGVRRILAVGDSFTMGHSVEADETFEKVAERALNTVGHGPVEILNTGVAGWSTIEELAYLRTRGLSLEPDLILLGFFVGNDIVDNSRSSRRLHVDNGFLTEDNGTPGLLPIRFRTFLARESQLYALVAPLQRRLRGLPVTNGPDPRSIYESDATKTAALWQATENVIASFVATARERRIPVMLMIMPEMIQVEPKRWTEFADRAGLESLVPNRRLMAIATQLGVKTLDLEPALSAAAVAEPLYFPLDSHWTVAGNRVVGEAVARFLEKQ